MVEEVSVLAADKRRKEPRSIPRPWERNQPDTGLVTNESGGLTATGHHAMLAAAQMRGAVRLG